MTALLALHLDDWLKILALLGASIAFATGLLQYRKAQRWKRAEFLANEMKDFFANPRVANALLLIDWGCRPIQLLDAHSAEDGWVKVTREMQTMGSGRTYFLTARAQIPKHSRSATGTAGVLLSHRQRFVTAMTLFLMA